MGRFSVARKVFVAVLLMVTAVAAAALGLARLSLGHGVRSVGSQLDQAFLAEQARHLWLIGGLALLLAALSALLAARALRDPVRKLVEGIRRLSAGDFAARIDIDRQDELGELASGFNRLARTLERHEASRRQWAADTSHELRTPIAVLRAELEALLDGVRQPDRRTLEALHGQVLSLGKLVEDLNELTRADVGQLQYSMSLVEPGAILLQVAQAYTERFAEAGIAITMPRTTHMATVQGDAERLRQLFVNLLENTLRYTDRGGRVELAVVRSGTEVVIRLEDSAPGVPDEALPHLFDRFYRADASRSRDKGGSGLGLALSKKIVEAHGGTITAEPSALGGLALEVRLPQKGVSL